MERTRRIGDMFGEIDNAIACMEAMSLLLERALRLDEGLGSISNGVDLLLTGQCEILKRASQDAWDEYRRVQHEKLTIKDPNQIAAMMGLSPKLVASVISHATGVSLDSSPQPVQESVNVAA